MRTFAKIIRRPEFSREFKKLIKKFRSLEDDLTVFEKTQLFLYHKQKIDNHGLVRINDLDIESPKIYKALKFACKSLKGRGAASGIRLIYAYFEAEDQIEYIQIYSKADYENEDRQLIKNIYGK